LSLRSRLRVDWCEVGASTLEKRSTLVAQKVGAATNWTNPSVLALAGDKDPVSVIIEMAHELALDAMDAGWSGPPYDPHELADFLNIRVLPTAEVRDARIVDGPMGYVIELNPNRPRVRQRFSLAHELAHTLFPDCAEAIRNRVLHAEAGDTDWEIEALCNVAAAEFLMPAGSMPERRRDGCIDDTVELRDRFQLSAEALMIRTAQLTSQAIAMFSASRLERGPLAGRYRLDYAIDSNTWEHDSLVAGELLPVDSPVQFCTGIGYTQKGTAALGSGAVRIECVGVTGYPGAAFPRVVGYICNSELNKEVDPIRYLRGNALEPDCDGVRIVAFLTNDVSPNWGGGFARQVASRNAKVQAAFRSAAQADRNVLALGNVVLIEASPTLYFAPIVAQAGIGSTDQPRIRYGALEEGLRKLGARAAQMGASVHMPRIGDGSSGGNWTVVRELVEEFLSPLADVRVYDLPPRSERAK